MKKYIITEDVLQGIIQYLVTRPYQEVKQGVEILSNLEEIKDNEIKENVEQQ